MGISIIHGACSLHATRPNCRSSPAAATSSASALSTKYADDDSAIGSAA